jgi:hypothetical protein
MIEIQPSHSTQHINYQSNSKRTITDYLIRSTVDVADLDLRGSELSLPPIHLQIRYDTGHMPEFSLTYFLFERPLQSIKTEGIPPPAPGSLDIPCKVLPLEIVQRALQVSATGEFRFSLIIDEEVDFPDLVARDVFERQVSPGEEDGSEVIFLVNRTSSELGDVPIFEYSETVGDLRTEIIWRVTIDGAVNEHCHLEIDDLTQRFGLNDYKERIEVAVRSFGGEVLGRIPAYFAQHFPLTDGLPLPVRVVIDEVPVNSPVRIYLARRAPELECFYPTGNDVLDKLIKHVHSELIRRGLPVSPASCQYQRVLNQFLKYRNSLLVANPKAKFADPNVLRKSELEFHNHLYLRFINDLDFGEKTIYEVTTGNSRIDLLISDIPTELKVERRPDVSTDDIVTTYCAQAADYVARCDSGFGFLVVLDAVLGRPTPTAPIEQDLVIVDVPTASGSSVAVIGIVMRLPEPPSLLSKAKTKVKSIVTRITST